MSLRNRIVLPLILSTLAVLAGCGGSSTPAAVAPPSGGFSASELSGTYVFSTAGSDPNGYFFTMAGTIVANGSGGITGGVIDINDSDIQVSTPIQAFGQAISSSSNYTVGVDGRGKINLVSTPLGTIVFDFVLSSNAGGLITEFDGNGSGSGTLELQSATITQAQLAQGYAFSLSGFDGGDNVLGGAGAFVLGSDGTITSGTGVNDFNDSGIVYPAAGLTGVFSLGTGGASGTAQLATAVGPLNFNFYVVDATHLKVIETDGLNGVAPVLSGDVFQQTSMPTGSLVFTMAGESSAGPLALGGLMTSSGAGQSTSGAEDVNLAGTLSSPTAPVPFSLNYTATTNGRATLGLTNFSGGPTSMAIYPTTEGVLMLEIDNFALTEGTAYAQSATALGTPPQGYGLNLSGVNFGSAGSGGGSFELDDIAEFATSASTGPSGLLDENDQGSPQNPQTISAAFSSLAADGSSPATGRGLASFASNSTTGLFNIIYYTVDGTNTIFMESDTVQASVGSFQLQSTGAKSKAASAAKPLILHPVVVPHSASGRLRTRSTQSR